MDRDIRLRPRRRNAVTNTRLIATIAGALVVVALAVWGATTALGHAAASRPIARVARGSVVASSATDLRAVAADVASQAVASGAPTTAAAATAATRTPAPPKPAPKAVAKPPVKPTGFVVVIDAGHQGHGDNTPEPIGPGSSITKPAVASGTSGVVTRVHESVVNLQVALRLQKALTARGIRVIMIRTSENVDIANSQRAKIANAAHAGLFIRLHCDGVAGHPGTAGLLTLVPAKNQWTGPIVSTSARAGRDIHAATLAATGATDRGITPRSDMSGFNWATVPSVIVEMGVMTNAAEDRLLSTAAYQDKLAAGMAAGIARFAAGN